MCCYVFMCELCLMACYVWMMAMLMKVVCDKGESDLRCCRRLLRAVLLVAACCSMCTLHCTVLERGALPNTRQGFNSYYK